MHHRYLSGSALLLSSVLLIACTTQPAVHLCEPTTLSATQAAASVLLRSAHSSPLYEQAIAPFGAASCRVQHDGSTVSVSIQSVGGNRLVLKRDPRIEYTSYEARFASPPTAPALETLARSERAAFGTNGCGIDWKADEKTTPPQEPQTVESIFRGDVCNCQARVRRNAAGAVIQLSLSSSC